MVLEYRPGWELSLSNEVVHNPVLLVAFKKGSHALFAHLELANLTYLFLLMRRVVLAVRTLTLGAGLPKTRLIHVCG
jgi:hypothetical protein